MRPDQKRRYLRHILLFGAEGQERLLAAAVAVDQASGAGAAALWYLAAAGVGTLVVGDEGVVLPEDVGLIFEIADVGRSRREAASERWHRNGDIPQGSRSGAAFDSEVAVTVLLFQLMQRRCT